MTDPLETHLRDALSHRAAQLDPDAVARLRAVDYRPRQRSLWLPPRLRSLPALGALGTAGAAAAVVAIVTLGSSAAPAFAGWRSTPTMPAASQLAHAAQATQACGQGLGSPVLADSRGPYTASVYADSRTSAVCLSGNGVSMSSRSTSPAPAAVPAGQIQLGGGGTRDSAGDALTVVDGRTGAGVTAVTIKRGDGSDVRATVANGWYLAWWPASVAATSALVTTASGTSTVTFPSAPSLGAPPCPAGSHCAAGYSFGRAPAGATAAGGVGPTVVRSGSASTGR